MSEAVIDAVEVFLGQPTSTPSQETLLSAFQKQEALHDGTAVHRPPYSKWRQHLGKERRESLAAHMGPQAKDTAMDAQTMILRLAVLMRVKSSVDPSLNEIAQHLLTADLSGISEDLLFEACNILQAIKAWKSLAHVAQCALINTTKRAETSPRTNILADFYVLANYKLLLPLFKANTLSEIEQKGFAIKIDALSPYLNNASKNMLFYRAIIANLGRDLDTAVSFVLAAQQAEGRMIGLFQRLESFTAPATLTVGPSETYKSLLDTTCHHYRHKPGDSPVLLVSSNDDYFARYHDKLIESFAYWNPAAILHIHCVNFEPAEKILDALEITHGIKINYSVDMQTLLMPGSQNFGGYCAGVRYIFLPEYLTTYSRIAVTDIDGLIRRPLAKLWQDNKDAILLTSKYMKSEWQSARLLWEMIAAGSFGITNSPENQEFAGYLSTYLCDQIAACEARGLKLFCTDQIGLLLAYMRCRETCEFTSCDDLYMQSGDWRFGRGDAKTKLQNSRDYRK